MQHSYIQRCFIFAFLNVQKKTEKNVFPLRAISEWPRNGGWGKRVSSDLFGNQPHSFKGMHMLVKSDNLKQQKSQASLAPCIHLSTNTSLWCARLSMLYRHWLQANILPALLRTNVDFLPRPNMLRGLSPQCLSWECFWLAWINSSDWPRSTTSSGAWKKLWSAF